MFFNDLIFIFILICYSYTQNRFLLYIFNKNKLSFLSDNNFIKPQAFHEHSTYRLGGVAIFAPLVSPTDPYDLNTVSIMNSRLPPLSEDFGGNYFLLGTDGAGRDMVSAIFYGLRVSLGVGVLSGIFALIIGSFFGISAAFFRGKYETFIMRIVDIQLSFPSILVALIILAAFGKGVEKTIIALIK